MSENKFFLCIDNGLSIGKTALVDLYGNVNCVVSFKNKVVNKDNYSEVDMNYLFDQTADAIQELIQKTEVNPAEIIAVGNSGHGGGIYLVDEFGNPLKNAITSMDSRAMNLIESWEKERVEYFLKTHTHMWNGQAIPLLYWLKKNDKDNYSKIHKILFCKDWIKFKLTGAYSTDYTDASNAGLISLESKTFDADLYKIFGLEDLAYKLPKINRSEEIIGFVTEKAASKTGLKKGTPVIAGAVDFVACLIGSGLYDESAYSIVSGTWGINSAICNNLISSDDIMALILFSEENKFLAMDTSPTSAVNLEWFLSEVLEKINCNNLNRKQLYKKIDDEIIKIKPQESSIYYFPFIFKSKLSKKMEGAFFGFNASHNLYDLLYSIYEGVVFSHLMHINNLKKGDIYLNKAILSGGAANSSLWCQLFSDILNMKIITTKTSEVGLLGLAIYQSTGLNLYKNLKESIENMVKIKSIYEPDKEKNNIYKIRFKNFEKIKKLFD